MPHSVQELQRLAKRDSEKTIRVFNPTLEDFHFKFGNETHTVRAGEIEPFKGALGKHAIKHLRTHVLNIRGTDTLDEEKMKELKKEVEVLL